MKRVVIILVTLISLLPLKVLAIQATVEEQRQAVLETALAFYNKGVQIQYDQYRRMDYATPEYASNNEYVFTDCASFTTAIYSNALNMQIPSTTYGLITYAKNNKNSANVLIYKDTNSEIYSNEGLGSDTTNVSVAIENLKKFVKTGDLLVIRKGGSGHVMFIDMSENKLNIIHSGGDYYNAKTHKDNFESTGTIRREPLEDYLIKLHNAGVTVTQIGILRFITDGKTYIDANNESKTYEGMTLSSAARLKYSQITINKNAKVINSNVEKDKNYVALGDVIQYTIEIINNSKSKYESLKVVEQKDDKVTFLDTGKGSVANNEISWTIDSIAPGETNKITYTVKVPMNTSILGKEIVSRGRVADIENKTITLLVANSLTKEEESKIIEAYNGLKSDQSIETEFISKIYQKSLGIDLTTLNNKTVYDFLSIKHCEMNKLCISNITNDYVKRMILKNLYGYRITATINESNKNPEHLIYGFRAWNVTQYDKNDRARNLSSKDLQIGDIIIVYSETNNVLRHKAYIYMGNNTLIRKESATSIVEHSDGTNGYYAFNTLLRNIIGDNYVVIRPALLIERQYEENPNIGNSITDNSNNEENLNTGNSITDNNNNEENPNIGNSITDNNNDEKKHDTGNVLTIGSLLILLIIYCAIYLYTKKSKSIF